MSSLEIFVVLLVGFVLPFILGHQLSTLLRMKKHSTRFSLSLVSIILCMIPFLFMQYKGKTVGEALKLGIDLAGGTNLLYQVDNELVEANKKTVNKQSMDTLVNTITKRVNPSGTEDVTVRTVGDDRIEVIVPGAVSEDVEKIKKQITILGSLEFGIVANRIDQHHSNAIKLAEAPKNKELHAIVSGSDVIAEWFPLGKDTKGKLKDIDENPTEGLVSRIFKTPNGDEELEYLIIKDPEEMRVTGADLHSVNKRMSMDKIGYSVAFVLTKEGGDKFHELTKKNKPRADDSKRRLAAILNGEIHTAPTINSPISREGEISGTFTSNEIDELVSVLNSGALELPLKTTPINEFTVSPLLGIDVREKGITAIVVSSLAVVLFILIYYRIAGVIAIISLLINMLMLMGCMSLINATFTLPGLAGIVLTIGMAVDANVLIYERMREEIQKGSSVRLAIQNGFEKAWRTIFDSNITTLLTAWILYYVGSEQIKGFAITLIIGIITSIFSAVYIGHLLFDIMEQTGKLKKLTFYNPLGVTSFKFLNYRYTAIGVSLIVIAVGFLALVSRGVSNMDIDFTGGSMVTFKFEKEPNIDNARKLLSEKFGSNISLERLFVRDDDAGQNGQNVLFRLRTSSVNDQEVRAKVEETFKETDYKLKKILLESYSSTEQKPQEEVKDATSNPATRFVSELSFSDELKLDTIEQKLVDAVNVAQEGKEKVVEIEKQLVITGKEGSGLKAAKNSIKRFSKVEVVSSTAISKELLDESLKELKKDMASYPLFDEVNTFDSSVAFDTQIDALKAILLSLVMIVFYVWFRFESFAFGIGAVVALIHDVCVCVVALPLASYLSGNPIGNILLFEDFKINLTIVAAVLTVVGYSINDTIVIFDRIREVKGKSPKLTEDMLNISLNQTLSRTILTSLTVFIVVLILYALGGEGIHGFAFCMVVGSVAGTYSSVYIAAPIVLWITNMSEKSKMTT